MFVEIDVPRALGTALSSSPGNFFALSLAAVLLGLGLMRVESVQTIGKLVLFFGAQSFMNIYIGWVMRTTVLLPKGTYIESTGYTLEEDLTGCPAGFALTAGQQLITFAVFCLAVAILYPTRWRYTPRMLESWFELRTIVITGSVFAFNIALNNLSLAYISVAVNLVLRSSLPLTTYIAQQIMSTLGLYPCKAIKWFETFLMSFGVCCACVFTAAQVMSEGATAESKHTVLGATICLLSVVCASFNMALTGVIGESKLKKYDAVAYMSLPAALVLLPMVVFSHNALPGEWSKVTNSETMTDLAVLVQVWQLNKSALMWLALSGVFSFAYNVVLFEIIHSLDPTAACVGGNCNKAAVIMLTMLVPALRAKPLPGMPWVAIMWIAVGLNVVAFAWYNWLQILGKKQVEAASIKRQLIRCEEDGPESGEKRAFGELPPLGISKEEYQSESESSSDGEDFLSWARRAVFGHDGQQKAAPHDEEE